MAHAPIVQDRTACRTVKALTIVARQDCEPPDNGGWSVRDVATGSGAPHIVVNGHCDCPDHTRRAAYCKHLQAVALEERELSAYCDGWNARSEQAQQNIQTNSSKGQNLPAISQQGNIGPNSDRSAEDLDWLTDDVNRDEYSGPYGSDGWPQPQPTCPNCGAELECQTYYVGGKGMTAFLICSKDVEHRALPA